MRRKFRSSVRNSMGVPPISTVMACSARSSGGTALRSRSAAGIRRTPWWNRKKPPRAERCLEDPCLEDPGAGNDRRATHANGLRALRRQKSAERRSAVGADEGCWWQRAGRVYRRAAVKLRGQEFGCAKPADRPAAKHRRAKCKCAVECCPEPARAGESGIRRRDEPTKLLHSMGLRQGRRI